MQRPYWHVYKPFNFRFFGNVLVSETDIQQRRTALIAVNPSPPGTYTLNSKETSQHRHSNPNSNNGKRKVLKNPFKKMSPLGPLPVSKDKEYDGMHSTCVKSEEDTINDAPEENSLLQLTLTTVLDYFSKSRVQVLLKNGVVELGCGSTPSTKVEEVEGSKGFETSQSPRRLGAKYKSEVRLILRRHNIDGTTNSTVINGVGYSDDAKLVEVAAAMHAERCLDEHGYHIFTSHRLQHRYAEKAREEGRYAPFPNDKPREFSEISIPFPLLYRPPTGNVGKNAKTSSLPADLQTGSSSKSASEQLQFFRSEAEMIHQQKVQLAKDRQIYGLRQSSDPLNPNPRGLKNRANGSAGEALSIDEVLKEFRDGNVFSDGAAAGEDEHNVIEVCFEGDEGTHKSSDGRSFPERPYQEGYSKPPTTPGYLSHNSRLVKEIPFSRNAYRHQEQIKKIQGLTDESEGGKFDIVDYQTYLSWDHTLFSPCFFNEKSVASVRQYLSSYFSIKRRCQIKEYRESIDNDSSVSDKELLSSMPPIPSLEDLISVVESEEVITLDLRGNTGRSIWYTTSFVIPGIHHDNVDSSGELRGNEGIAIGKARTREKALICCCMQAELLIDQHGLPLFPENPIKQMLHAEVCQNLGRYAAFPSDDEIEKALALGGSQFDPKTTMSPGVSSGTKFNTKGWSALQFRNQFIESSLHYHLIFTYKGEYFGYKDPVPYANTVLRVPYSSIKNLNEIQKPLKEWVRIQSNKGVKSRHRVSIPSEEELYLQKHRQFITKLRMHISEFGLMTDQAIFKEMHLSLKIIRKFCIDAGSVRKIPVIIFFSEHNQYRASITLPLPSHYGDRGGYGVGITPSSAIGLAAIHAVDSLCALCIPISSNMDTSEVQELLKLRTLHRRVPFVTDLNVSPTMRSPPGYREITSSFSKSPDPAEIWKVMVTDVSEFDVIKVPKKENPVCLATDPICKQPTQSTTNILRQIVMNFFACYGHPECLIESDNSFSQFLHFASHYNGHQKRGHFAAVPANNYWMRLPVPEHFGTRIAWGRCITRKGAQRALLTHIVRILFTLGLYPNEPFEPKGYQPPIFPSVDDRHPRTNFLSRAAFPNLTKRYNGVNSDWDLWLSLPDGIISEIIGTDIGSAPKTGDERTSLYAPILTEAEVVESTESKITYKGPGVYDNRVWSNSREPLDENRFPAALAIRKQKEFIAMSLQGKVPSDIPNPNPVTTSFNRESILHG
eukprot:Tbor_TRINITY_DN2691_c0_g1::TRINITY_DN2691_c0_g1_i1::g.18020::m.18020